MAENSGNNSSAITVLITIVIVLIIGAAFYFGVVRGKGNDNNQDSGGVNVELNTSGGSGGESPAY